MDLKFQQSLQKWENDLIFLRTIGDDGKLYKYTGNCCEKLFDYKIDNIDLHFQENKLVAIYITTVNLQESKDISGKSTLYYGDDAQNINSSIAFLFGEPTSKRMPEDSDDIFLDWQAENVMLSSKYIFLGTFSGDKMQITVALNSYVFHNLKSGF